MLNWTCPECAVGFGDIFALNAHNQVACSPPAATARAAAPRSASASRGDELMARLEATVHRVAPGSSRQPAQQLAQPPRNADLGDQIVALMRGTPEGDVAVVGHTSTAPRQPPSPDIGDAIVALLQGHEPAAPSDPSSRATQSSPDLGDKIVELCIAEREQREPAAWARS